ncbi:MAG: hypothetical protein B6D38_01470 [Anaerolineae bacterium UTCFX1]|jgi:hypothetical protein|nr:MAG: hypothetical protein B6D38_01470 [Anaerolineae bacterium UTCFX1]
MRNKMPIAFAVLALLLVSFACSFGGGEPTLSNARTSFDSDGKQISSTFGAFDTVYVVADLENAVSGNKVVADWYAENADGVDPNYKFDTVDYTITEDAFDGIVYFSRLPPDGGWPVGTYRVELLFNGTLNATVTFTIQ